MDPTPNPSPKSSRSKWTLEMREKVDTKNVLIR